MIPDGAVKTSKSNWVARIMGGAYRLTARGLERIRVLIVVCDGFVVVACAVEVGTVLACVSGYE